MVAGQQKKRLIASSTVSCFLQEQSNAKKKKDVESSKNLLNMKAHISLEWDDNQKKVVARREQIGITWRDLVPFTSPFSQCRKGLADVFPIPPEIFGLEDMTNVLSFEVWATYLSETERNLLTQFLPKEADVKHVVQSLLTGENFHFGNPLLKWGSLLCSGNLHPDAVLSREQCFFSSTKAYHLDLQKHHNEMLENLQKWKERWESCEDPEEDILQMTQRKGYLDKRRNSLTASDRRKAASKKEEKLPKLDVHSGDCAKYMSYVKITRKQLQLVKSIKQSGDGIRSKSLNRVLGDIKSYQVQPYEAYEQEECKKVHEHWMQLANGDIPSAFANWTERQLKRHLWRRSLDMEILEKKISLDAKRGKPYSSLQEERDNERTCQCQEVDVNVLSVDEELASFCIKSQHLQRIPSLNDRHEHELMDGEVEESDQDILKLDGEEPASYCLNSQDLHRVSSLNDRCELELMDGEVEEGIQDILKPEGEVHASYCIKGQHLQRIPSLNDHHELELMDGEVEKGSPDILEPEGASPFLSKFLPNTNGMVGAVDGEVPSCSVKESIGHSIDGHPLQRIPSLNGHCELDDMDMELGDGRHGNLRPESQSPIISEFVGDMNSTVDAVGREVLVSSTNDVEVGSPLLNMPDSCCHPIPVTHRYTSSSGLSLKKPHPLAEQSGRFIDLETDILIHEDQETLLHSGTRGLGSAFHIERDGSFFGSYTNQDHNAILQPFLKGQEMLPFHVQEHKQVETQFPATSSVSLESGHREHFLEQHQQLLEQRQQMRERDFCMPQIIRKNLNFGGGRYTNPSQELLSSVNLQHWATDPAHVSDSMQTHASNRELLGQNCFSAEHRAHNGWSVIDVSSTPSQCAGNGSGEDGSLYSVLSQFSKLQSHSSYNFISSDQPSAPARNFVGMGISGDVDVFPGAPQQLNYLRGREATAVAAMKANSMSWTNLPHQNSGLNDPTVRPFLRSWNQ